MLKTAYISIFIIHCIICLIVVFNLFDLEFNGFLNAKSLQKVLPIMMQDVSIRTMEMEELKLYSDWFETIADFAIIQFDRAKQGQGRLSHRDFRFLARYDLTIKHIMEQIEPKKPEYIVFEYARTVGKKKIKPKSKTKQKRRVISTVMSSSATAQPTTK